MEATGTVGAFVAVGTEVVALQLGPRLAPSAGPRGGGQRVDEAGKIIKCDQFPGRRYGISEFEQPIGTITAASMLITIP